MESEQKRALLAVILSGLVLFGWQKFYAPKSQELNKNSIVKTVENFPSKSENEAQLNKVELTEPVKEIDLQEIYLQNNEVEVSFYNNLTGFNIKNKKLDFSSSEIILDKNNNFSIEILNNSNQKYFQNFATVRKIDSTKVELIYSEDKKLEISLNNDGIIVLKTNFESKFKFNLNSSDKRLENGQVRLFKVMSSEVEDYDLKSDESFELKTQWFGVDYNYHLFAISFLNKTDLSYSLKKQEKNVTIEATQTHFSNNEIELVFAKKNYDDLIKLGRNLDKSVDFGILGILAVPILRGLQFFYNVFPNYGVSIIILTIIIRLITFPLQYKSFKSMKKMSTLQPEINKLKEKFKEDPQRLQKETMELFKRSGANPLGGCLPMLLQMPVFFAFYKVLYAAVELVGQPFYFWISDLSEKDPYFILPVILTAAMFFQQKLTPNTSTDPTQQKVMLFMPIIFGFIMKDMPAGLVLYICVSTIFQMIQQIFVNKAA